MPRRRVLTEAQLETLFALPTTEADLAHLAPLGWRHINLTGDYLWTGDSKFDPDGFRALRSRPAALATLAAA